VRHIYTVEWTISRSGRTFHVNISHKDPEKAKEMTLEFFKASKKFLSGRHGAYSI